MEVQLTGAGELHGGVIAMPKSAKSPRSRRPKRGLLSRLFRSLLLLVAAFYVFCTLALVALRWVDPPFVATQVQRRVESWFAKPLKNGRKPKYVKRYTFVPLARISRNLQHATVAAEDGRFFQHHGFDWDQMEIAMNEKRRRGPRGASTITMQLVKNIFFGPSRSFVRKGFEFTLTPIAELVLSKQRILELYLNVIEWGPGVYGAEEAARYHYGIPAARLNRDQASRLAAIIPSPRRWKPQHMNDYSATIQERMTILGW